MSFDYGDTLKMVPAVEVKKITYKINLEYERVPRLVIGLRRLTRIIKSVKTIRRIKHEGVPLFEPLSFDLMPGSTLAISGPSKSGKTVFARILGGALLPSSGEAIIRGRFAPVVGGTRLFMEEGSLKSNILYVSAMCGFGKKEILPFVDKVIDWAEIKNSKKRKTYELTPIEAVRLLVSIGLHLPANVILIDGLLDSPEVFDKNKLISCINEIRNRNSAIIVNTKHFSNISFLMDKEVKLIPTKDVVSRADKIGIGDTVAEGDEDDDI